MSNPHDTFFRRMMEREPVPKEVLRVALPEEVSRSLDLDSLQAVAVDLGDARLAAPLATDFTFQLKRRDGNAALVHIVLEHQSSVDDSMAHRLLRYRVRLWDAWRSKHPKGRLPAIVPVVLYHGNKPWDAPREFSELVDPSDGRTAVTAAYHLLDLSRWTDAHIVALGLKTLSALTLSALIHSRRKLPVHRWMKRWAKALGSEAGRRVFNVIINYFWDVRDDTEPDKMREVARTIDPELEAAMVSYGERLREEGREEARRQMLLGQLEVKFGALEPATVLRIENASAEELTTWLLRVVTADSIAAVFEG